MSESSGNYKSVGSYDALRKVAGARDIPLSASEIGSQPSHRKAQIQSRIERNRSLAQSATRPELKAEYEKEVEKLEKLLSSGEWNQY